MLQEFLNHNFIRISEDENLNKLKKACDDIVKKIEKNKSKIINYTLTALDPEISANNSDIIDVKKIIIKRWSTFISYCKDTPVTYIRAVMLEVLQRISKETNYACLIWFTGHNVIKYYNLGREKDLLVNFLVESRNRIENIAKENWTLLTEVKHDKLSIEIKELTGVTIDKATLQKKLEDASGPNKADGTPNYESPNPHWPNANNNWSFQFAPRAAQGITEVVNKALKGQAKELSLTHNQIQEVIIKLLNKAQTEILQNNSILQLRAQLLWWKESCYSTTLKRSYRGLRNGLLQTALANDYAILVPYIYPTIIEYFLKETYYNLTSLEDNKIKMSELLKHIETSSSDLRTVFSEFTSEEGRVSLMSYVRGLVWNKYTLKQFKKLVGIPESIEITFVEYMLWIFHDLQAFKISTIN